NGILQIPDGVLDLAGSTLQLRLTDRNKDQSL
ncbi:hypothetical protein CCACVL1_22736, partial [Corchorus capsularis]